MFIMCINVRSIFNFIRYMHKINFQLYMTKLTFLYIGVRKRLGFSYIINLN